MSLIEVVLSGVILGGLYALIAIGFNLQYGVARIFNLAYGEFLMAAAFAAFWMFTLASIDPILGMLVSVPVTFGANWLVYRFLMLPLVRRARTRDDLEGDTILATFGLLFVLKGAAHQRKHEKAIDQPIGAERHRHGQQHAKDRIDRCCLLYTSDAADE